MGMAEHFSGVVLVRTNGTRPQVLIQEYIYHNTTQIKFPGGTNENRPGENPTVTANREFLEETGLLLNDELVLIFEDRSIPGHAKFFYLAANAEGEVRTRLKEDDGEEDLLPPTWVDVDKALITTIYHTHKPALRKAMSHMAQKNEDWGWLCRRLANLF